MQVPVVDAPTSPFEADRAGARRRPVGIIVNRRSLRNRRGGGTPVAVASPDVHVAVPGNREELADAVAGFARREVATVVVDGGDGTVRDVLTALAAAYGARQPRLAVMSSGNTNLIAGDIGGIPAGAEGVDLLLRGLAGDRPLRQASRCALDVTWLGGPPRLVRGMMFGAAAFARGTDLANESLQPRGVHHGAAVAFAMAGMLCQTLFGRGRRRLLDGEPMSIRVDDGPAVDGSRFLMMATPLDRLVLGLWPFADTGAGPLHWLDVAAPPRHLLRLAAAALRGRPPRRAAEYGHRSGRAAELQLALARPFVVDGDRFEPGPAGVRLTASPPLRFLST